MHQVALDFDDIDFMNICQLLAEEFCSDAREDVIQVTMLLWHVFVLNVMLSKAILPHHFDQFAIGDFLPTLQLINVTCSSFISDAAEWF